MVNTVWSELAAPQWNLNFNVVETTVSWLSHLLSVYFIWYQLSVFQVLFFKFQSHFKSSMYICDCAKLQKPVYFSLVPTFMNIWGDCICQKGLDIKTFLSTEANTSGTMRSWTSLTGFWQRSDLESVTKVQRMETNCLLPTTMALFPSCTHSTVWSRWKSNFQPWQHQFVLGSAG